jgi:hypothetical protein
MQNNNLSYNYFATLIRNYDKVVNKMGVMDDNEVLQMVQDTFSPPTDSDNMIFNKNYYKAKKEVNKKVSDYNVCIIQY